MNRSKLLLILLSIGAAVGLLIHFSLQRPTDDARLTKLTLGYRPGVAVDLPLIQAVENGELRRAGYDIELRPYGRADLIFAALKSGEIQGSLGVPLEPLLDQAATGNYPVTAFLVWYFDSKTGYDGFIGLASGPKNVEELNDKSIASHPSKQVTYFVKQMVPTAMVKPYNPAAPLTSLDSGDVSAAYVLEPFLSIAAQNSKYRVIERNSISNRVFGGARVPAAVTVLSSSWIEKNADRAADFIAKSQSIFTAFDSTKLISARMLLQKPEFGALPSSVTASVVEPSGALPQNVSAEELDTFHSKLKGGNLIASGTIDFARLFYKPAPKQ